MRSRLIDEIRARAREREREEEEYQGVSNRTDCFLALIIRNLIMMTENKQRTSRSIEQLVSMCTCSVRPALADRPVVSSHLSPIGNGELRLCSPARRGDRSMRVTHSCSTLQ